MARSDKLKSLCYVPSGYRIPAHARHRIKGFAHCRVIWASTPFRQAAFKFFEIEVTYE